jgi:ferric-dicitrate binding protein FerR (iron transport regulator)
VSDERARNAKPSKHGMDELILRSLHGETTETAERMLSEWRQASPANEAHYNSVRDVWHATSPLAPALRGGGVPTAESLLERERSPLRRSFWPGTFVRGLRWALVPAAVAVAAFLIGMPQADRTPESAGDRIAAEYVTGPRELLSVPLRDGSVVRLAPSSRLRVAHEDGGRTVWLDGRAYFSVASQNEQFRVRTSAGEAVVLGTRFDLQAQDRELRLVVVQGRVGLSDGRKEVLVDAGEVSAVVNGKVTQAVPVPDSRAIVDWIGNFLVFDGTPLSQAAAEFSSLFGVEIRIEDEDLANRTLTGWFSDQSYEEVLTAVCRVVDARCTIGETLVVIDR